MQTKKNSKTLGTNLGSNMPRLYDITIMFSGTTFEKPPL